MVGGLGSEAFEREQTSRFIRPVLEWLFPDEKPYELAGYHRTIRKGAHVAEYAVASFLVFRAWSLSLAAGARPHRTTTVAARTLLLVLALAVLDEVRQGFLPRRSGEPGDVLLDMAGALAALPLAAWWVAAGQRAAAREGDG